MIYDFSNFRIPPPPKRIETEKELDAFLGNTPERIAADLGLKPPLRDYFFRWTNFPRANLRSTVRDLGLIDYTAAPPKSAYSHVESISSAIDDSSVHGLIEFAGQLRFKVDEQALSRPENHGLFRAWFLDFPAALLPERRIESSFDSHALVLRLSEAEMKEIQAHLRPSHREIVPNGFGFIRFEVTKNGDVFVREFRNDLYERLTDATLRERYKAWPELLLRAFHHYIHARPAHFSLSVAEQLDTDKLGVEPTRILFPSPESVAVSLDMGTPPPVGWSIADPNSPGNRTSPRQSAEELQELFDVLPRKHGYRLSNPSKVPASKEASYFIERTIMPLSAESIAKSDAVEARLFTPLPPSRYKEIRQFSLERFPVDYYRRVATQGVNMWHSLPPRPPNNVQGFERLLGQFVLTPAEGCTPQRLRSYTEPPHIAHLQLLREGRQAKIIDDLLGKDFTMISQGAWGKANENWWEIPEVKPGAITINGTHLDSQNRHPHIRVAIGEQDGSITRFAIGFKGGGYLSAVDTNLPDRGDNLVLPIEINKRASPYTDPLSQTHPAPTPKVWGGESFDDNMDELIMTLRFRHFLSAKAPDLESLLPLPYDVREMLSMPLSREGKVQWLGATEYCHTFFKGSKVPINGPFATYISSNRSDVRLRQAVNRIFVRSAESEGSLDITAHEIESALQALFWWNAEAPDVPPARSIRESTFVDLNSVMHYLAEVAASDTERAHRVFSRAAGALCELTGLVHALGGHFGGSWHHSADGRQLGVSYGGPLALRNVDLTGGIHDLNLNRFFFPWENLAGKWSWNEHARQIAHREINQQFDLMYLGETVYWLHKMLFGSSHIVVDRAGMKTVMPNEFTQISVLSSSNDQEALGLELLAKAVEERKLSLEDAVTLALPELAREHYWRGYKRI